MPRFLQACLIPLLALGICVPRCPADEGKSLTPTPDAKGSTKPTTTAPPKTPRATGAEDSNSNVRDPLRDMQSSAIEEQTASWGHWGNQPDHYSTWVNHSNRLIPVYTFGITLGDLREQGSAYADPKRLEQLYGKVPEQTLNPTAMYFDQTDIFQLQHAALDAGYSNIILMIFDGMDWQTTRATSLYKQQQYESGRGTGLAIQDDRRVTTDFGLVCTSPRLAGVKFDVNSQTVLDSNLEPTGGYDPTRGGEAPWLEQPNREYLLGIDREQPHTVTDSAASATSMTCGVKTYNGAIAVTEDGTQLTPIGRVLQQQDDFKIGVVTSVPVTHATPACAYANNVSRKDYQDIGRDLLGLRSSAHRNEPLSGVDVLLGGGWGEHKDEDEAQGDNFVPGNPYLHEEDIRKSDLKHGGKYVVAQRTPGKSGRRVLRSATRQAVDGDHRLLGFFGVDGGHLPFQTADGQYDPAVDVKAAEEYSAEDLNENPTLAELTRAALLVLEQAIDGFWLVVEAGDVDWANHSNNIDNAIGSVLSGDDAFRVILDWVDENDAWSYTAVIVTADHGHYLVIDEPDRFVQAGKEASHRASARRKQQPADSAE
ncbi:MAG: alkaline phosphatase [Rubripirellula sp.]